ncbi:unnamed protein product, partial [Polarella glacialis]
SLGDLQAAGADFKRCLEADPGNADAKRGQEQVLRAMKHEDAKSKGMFAKMCQGLGDHSGTAGKENERPSLDDGTETEEEKGSEGDDESEPNEAEMKSLDGQLIEPGKWVRIEGLVSRTDLNGSEGRVVAWDSTERRWRLTLATELGVCVKPANLVVMPPMPGFVMQRVKFGPARPPK